MAAIISSSGHLTDLWYTNPLNTAKISYHSINLQSIISFKENVGFKFTKYKGQWTKNEFTGYMCFKNTITTDL